MNKILLRFGLFVPRLLPILAFSCNKLLNIKVGKLTTRPGFVNHLIAIAFLKLKLHCIASLIVLCYIQHKGKNRLNST